MMNISQSPPINLIINAEKPQVVLSVETFNSLRSYIYELCGIYYQDNKKYLLESRLQKRINYLNLKSYEQYLDFIKFNPGGKSEQRYLFEAITINETFFFRNQPQLDALISNIIPELISIKKSSCFKLRIWSAASSSGEEAYSIAMALNESIRPKYPNMEFEIVGTDISQSVVDIARRGVYREYSIRNTPAYYLNKYFKNSGGNFEIDQNIKKYVSFKILNLYDDPAMKAMNSFDVIFCANVLIYFDMKSKMKVVSHLYNNLNRGGYLFIGYAETLNGISKAFKLISYPKTMGYKKE